MGYGGIKGTMLLSAYEKTIKDYKDSQGYDHCVIMQWSFLFLLF